MYLLQNLIGCGDDLMARSSMCFIQGNPSLCHPSVCSTVPGTESRKVGGPMEELDDLRW